MSQELLYTSAPRGLKAGSRGFCTVLSSQGMSAPLVTAVESLSGYRPLYPPDDPRAASNPVVYSHLKLQAAGRSWHVLSRIADYGLDYSQRTNKLAHHVVIDNVSEQLQCGPADLLLKPGFMRDHWEGEPQVVPPKLVKCDSANFGVCQHWKNLTGDAGWAGVVAESFLRTPDRLVILLFEPGQDILSLYQEVLSLLPDEKRWDATFSTYFTALGAGTICNWRAIVSGSKEAHESLRFVDALRIDLTSGSLGRAAGAGLVDAARSGDSKSIHDAIVQINVDDLGEEHENTRRQINIQNAGEASGSADCYSAFSPPLLRIPPPVSWSKKNSAGRGRSVKSLRLRRLLISAIVFLTLIGIVIVVSYVYRERDIREKHAPKNSSDSSDLLSVDDGVSETTLPIKTLVAAQNIEVAELAVPAVMRPAAPIPTLDDPQPISALEYENKSTLMNVESESTPRQSVSNVPETSLSSVPERGRYTVIWTSDDNRADLKKVAPTIRIYSPEWLKLSSAKSRLEERDSKTLYHTQTISSGQLSYDLCDLRLERTEKLTELRLYSQHDDAVPQLSWATIDLFSDSGHGCHLKKIVFASFPVEIDDQRKEFRNRSLEWQIPNTKELGVEPPPIMFIEDMVIRLKGDSECLIHGEKLPQAELSWQLSSNDVEKMLVDASGKSGLKSMPPLATMIIVKNKSGMVLQLKFNNEYMKQFHKSFNSEYTAIWKRINQKILDGSKSLKEIDNFKNASKGANKNPHSNQFVALQKAVESKHQELIQFVKVLDEKVSKSCDDKALSDFVANFSLEVESIGRLSRNLQQFEVVAAKLLEARVVSMRLYYRLRNSEQPQERLQEINIIQFDDRDEKKAGNQKEAGS